MLQTLFAEFKLLHHTVKEKKGQSKKSPWDMPERLRTFGSQAPHTLFGVKFLAVIMDEAHSCRNPGSQHSAAIAITQNAYSRLILTATPLQTRTEASDRDLLHLGYI